MESPGHVYLVEILERWVQINRPNSLEYLLLDRYERELQSRPFKIGDHKPDLYLKDSRLEETIVGEAKTSKDLKTLHTYEQLEEFLVYAVTNRAMISYLSNTNIKLPVRNNKLLGKLQHMIDVLIDLAIKILYRKFSRGSTSTGSYWYVHIKIKEDFNPPIPFVHLPVRERL